MRIAIIGGSVPELDLVPVFALAELNNVLCLVGIKIFAMSKDGLPAILMSHQ